VDHQSRPESAQPTKSCVPEDDRRFDVGYFWLRCEGAHGYVAEMVRVTTNEVMAPKGL